MLYSKIRRDVEEISKCIKCGFCQASCPIYEIKGEETSCLRGRIALLQAVIEGKVELTQELESPIYECLMCRSCTTDCYVSIEADRITHLARSAYLKKYGMTPGLEFFFKDILPNPVKLTYILRLLSIGKKIGLSELLPVLAVLGWIDRDFSKAKDIVRLPHQFLRDKLPELNLDKIGKLKVGYFVGCGINYLLPDVGVSTLEILNKANAQIEILENYCCGLPPYSYGDIDTARLLARRNLEIFKKSHADIILSDCSSCASFLKDYPKLLQGIKVPKIMDITEFLVDKSLHDSKKNKDRKVTFHYPCHLSRYQELGHLPREIIKGLGFEFIEMEDALMCCGGAGTFNLSHYNLSMKVLEKKIENIRETHADYVITTCPSCLIQLSYGARHWGLNVKVLHLTELLR